VEEERITIAIPEDLGAAIIPRDVAEQPKMEILAQVIIPASTLVFKIKNLTK
jgi:hypothetical protein